MRQSNPNIREITAVLEAVEAESGVPMARLLGSGRPNVVVYARIEAAKRLRELKYSTAQIGKVLNRDHTTVVFYLGGGKRKPVPPRWRAPKIKHLNCPCHPWPKEPEPVEPEPAAVPLRRDPAYLLPYAGADFREYKWKVRPHEGA